MRIFEDVGEGRGIVRFSEKECSLLQYRDPAPSGAVLRGYLVREARLAGLVEPFEIWHGWHMGVLIVQGKIGPQFDPGD